MKYKAIQQFSIHIPIDNRTITDTGFTDEDVEILFKRWPNKFNHNFALIGEVEEVIEAEADSFPQDAPNKDWTVKQLRDYASMNGIKLGRAKSEDAILNAINRALDGE